MYYVYAHKDPTTKEIVYIGKGKGGRAWDVTRCRSQHKEHQDWMVALLEQGYLPSDWVIILHKQLSEKEAFDAETSYLQSRLYKYNRQIGQHARHAKMTNEQAMAAYKMAKVGVAHKDIAELYGVSRSSISMLASGRQWRAVTAGIRNEDKQPV